MASSGKTGAWRALHRRLALVAGLGALLWSVSGLLHPLLVRVQPQPEQRTAPALEWQTGEALLSPAELRPSDDLAQVSLLRLIVLDRTPYYQLQAAPGTPPRYFHARSGAELARGDRVYAEYLARHFTGDHNSPVRRIQPVARFGGEYDAINRMLPVYRVEFARPDGLRAYVDTTRSGLGTLVDDRKALLEGLFRNLHKWDWLAGLEPLRLLIALLFITAALTTALTGVTVFFRARASARLTLSVWHRWLGLGAAVFLLSFAASGGLHLVKMSLNDTTPPPRLPASVTLGNLTAAPDIAMALVSGPLQALSVTDIGGQPYYRLEQAAHSGMDGHHAHHGPDSGQATAEPAARFFHAEDARPANISVEDHARHIAAGLTGHAAIMDAPAAAVNGFGGEYGFVNKYLPVTRLAVGGSGEEALFIHSASATLAARIDNADRLEGWLFAWLHKWHFMAPLGADLRDALMALAAFAIACVSLLGYGLLLRRRRQPRGRSNPRSTSDWSNP